MHFCDIVNNKERWWIMERFQRVVMKFISPQGNLFRYSLSFCVLLALLPALIIFLKVFQTDILSAPNLINLLYDYVPETILAPFVEYVMSQEYTTFVSLIISMGFSIYLASNAFYSFMLISMTDEGFDTYAILVRIKAIVVFVLLVIGLVGLTLFNYLVPINSTIVMLAGLFIVFYCFYRYLSFEKKPLSYGLIGAAFTSACIVLIGVFFFYIVNHYTRYNALYGPLASLVIMLISIYLISSVIYFGYCLNHEYGKSFSKRTYKHQKFYDYGNNFLDKIVEKFGKLI